MQTVTLASPMCTYGVSACNEVTQLGKEQVYVPYFRIKEHCSSGLKSSWPWAWLLLIIAGQFESGGEKHRLTTKTKHDD